MCWIIEKTSAESTALKREVSVAFIDYQHCAVCGAKTFYDANIDWAVQRVVEVASLCDTCAPRFTLRVVTRTPDTDGYAPWVNTLRPNPSTETESET